MLDNWLVLCFDHQLQLLWSQAIASIIQPPDEHFVNSVAIMVLPISFNRRQTGLIIVGGGRGRRDNDKRYLFIIFKYVFLIECKLLSIIVIIVNYCK